MAVTEDAVREELNGYRHEGVPIAWAQRCTIQGVVSLPVAVENASHLVSWTRSTTQKPFEVRPGSSFPERRAPPAHGASTAAHRASAL